MSLQPGARLGPYEILATIGSGGMGEVYRCRDTRVPRTTVALKVLAPAVAEDADFRKRFAREAEIIAHLDHPHICALYDVGEIEGVRFIVMPILEGRSLASRLGEGAIPVGEALRIAIAVASALAYAHDHGVLHRDVKPSNIMLGADGSVKLVDFGIARTTGAAGAGDIKTERLTNSGRVLGTLEYMSPEQLSGEHVDERSDIFSLGVVIYEMVAARHPFRQEVRMFTACAILDAEYPPISSDDPLVQALNAILAIALSRDPNARDKNMSAFLKELEFLQQAGAPIKVGDDPPPQPRAWNYRTVGAALAASAAVVTLALLLGNRIATSPDMKTGTMTDSVPAAATTPGGIVHARPQKNGAISSSVNYRRVTATAPSPVAGNVSELGVTVWRLRRGSDRDQVRLLVHETAAGKEEWTPERVELHTPLVAGDRVRISIESPRAGYLYVIDRERYSDGSTGLPHVIFPTSHTSGGENRVAPGRLIDVPAQTDRPPYFTLRSSRADHAAELLTVIVSDQQIPELAPGDKPMQITPAVLAQWEKRGSPKLIEHLELAGGAGRAWSAEEQRAAADATRVLTQDAPPPQTVFRIVTNEPGFLVAQVMLTKTAAN